ncbi:hypothetical protein L596_015307 [Steinernema carpocapsae]|uniref:Uncharacterized protein n=1 Tax=Steinernema carpocapsae TaxID=34508 RepID=A0A4U5NEL6_STECR|nr:hypothetical protein L596_015307 [Steinernema carpocapsae]
MASLAAFELLAALGYIGNGAFTIAQITLSSGLEQVSVCELILSTKPFQLIGTVQRTSFFACYLSVSLLAFNRMCSFCDLFPKTNFPYYLGITLTWILWFICILLGVTGVIYDCWFIFDLAAMLIHFNLVNGVKFTLYFNLTCLSISLVCYLISFGVIFVKRRQMSYTTKKVSSAEIRILWVAVVTFVTSSIDTIVCSLGLDYTEPGTILAAALIFFDQCNLGLVDPIMYLALNR